MNTAEMRKKSVEIKAVSYHCKSRSLLRKQTRNKYRVFKTRQLLWPITTRADNQMNQSKVKCMRGWPSYDIRTGVSRDFKQPLERRRRRHLKNAFAFLCCDNSSTLKLSNIGELSKEHIQVGRRQKISSTCLCRR